MAKRKLSFEESLKRLEEIINHLEKGDIPLEQSLSLFEEGAALLASCNGMLQHAEQKVAELKVGESVPEEIPFDE